MALFRLDLRGTGPTGFPVGGFQDTRDKLAAGRLGNNVNTSLRNLQFIGGSGGAVSTPSFTFQNGKLTRSGDNALNLGREQLSRFSNLAGKGFGDFKSTTRRSFGDARSRAVGNLRESLGRRRVLGASFAGDAIARTRLSFLQEEQAALAKIETDELTFRAGVERDRSNFLTTQIQGELNEFQLASGFSDSLNQLELQRLEILAELDRQRTVSVRTVSSGGSSSAPTRSIGSSTLSSGGFSAPSNTQSAADSFRTFAAGGELGSGGFADFSDDEDDTFL